MASIPNVIEAMQSVLGEQADQIGRASGFIKRQRLLTGSSFARSLVFGWLGNEAASLRELSQVAQVAGVTISRQGLAQRFTAEAVDFMEMLLRASLQTMISGHSQTIEALAPFGKIYVMDSTVVSLPAELATHWPGIQGSGLKLSVCWDVQNGHLPLLHKHAAREHDGHAPLPLAELGRGDLWLADLAYFKLDRFEQLSAQGTYWLSRLKVGTRLYHRDGRPFDLEAYLPTVIPNKPHEIEVLMGRTHQLPVRLIIQQITDPQSLARRQTKLKNYERKKQTRATAHRRQLCNYDVYVTNIPDTLASPTRLLALARVRWQIENLFKLWKNELHLDEWRSMQPRRILCELYAKLIALIIQHWLFLMSDGHHLVLSLTQARTIVRHYSWIIAQHLFDTLFLRRCLLSLQQMFRTCRTFSSPRRLSTFKRLTA